MALECSMLYVKDFVQIAARTRLRWVNATFRSAARRRILDLVAQTAMFQQDLAAHPLRDINRGLGP